MHAIVSIPTFARHLRTAALSLLLASALLAADPKSCLDLSASIDNDTQSPSGIRVTVSGYNHCSEDLDGGRCRFRVSALGPGGKVIAGQSGGFGGSIAPQGSVETKVFISCDPERVQSIRVDAQ